MEINQLQRFLHEHAVEKGFWDEYRDDYKSKCTFISLIMTELGEAVQALREENEEKFHEELVDAMMFMLDFAEGLKIDTHTKMMIKVTANLNRPSRHGKRF